MSVALISSAASHVGKVRERNEDAFAADDGLGLYVVADGMGGHPNGHVASANAVSAVCTFVEARYSAGEVRDVSIWAREAVLAANAEIEAANAGLAAHQQMGTTLCVLLIDEDGGFALANVGDSRCYRVEADSDRGRGRIDLISRDDTVAADLIARGVAPELVRGAQHNTLTQAIGMMTHRGPNLSVGMLHPGDAVIMCTDGVTNYVDDTAFRGVLMALREAPDALVQALIRGALNGGGGDNCTCIGILARDPA